MGGLPSMIAGFAIAAHAIAMPGMPFLPEGPVDPGIVPQPGLEFTLPDRLLHYTQPLRRMHFTLVDDDA
ncbi:MAG: hypothetical protein R3E64_04050 [Halioglobus sp.]